ncbi:MAG: hypothetical protein ABIP48_19085 [Planctomycetota bacterium]
MVLRLDHWIAERVTAPSFRNGFDLVRWLEKVRRRMSQPELTATVVWPPPARSLGRLYVHLLSRQGQRVAFAKVSFDDYNDLCLRNEGEALVKLAGLGPTAFRVPGAIDQGEFQGHRYLVMEPLPADAVAVEPSWFMVKANVADEYAGPVRKIGSGELKSQCWWQRFRSQTTGISAFTCELDRMGYEDVPVCRAHGDLAPHNIVRAGRHLWVYDWEEASESAPIRTDEIRFFLALQQRRILRQPRSGPKLVAERLGVNGRERRDVLMGLAFLHGAGVRAAQEITKHWK